MAISTSALRVAAAFVVQKGIATWEGPEPLDDSRWMTVSVLGSQLRHVIPILWTLIGWPPSNGKVVYRIHISGLPEMVTRTLRRNLMAKLSADMPGFRDTHANVGEKKLCVISKLANPSSVDASSLTFYRHTALIETDSSIFAPSELCDQLCPNVSDFDAGGIACLLTVMKKLGVYRVLDLETHAVVQFIGSHEASGAAVRLLVDRKFRQLTNDASLHEVILSLRE